MRNSDDSGEGHTFDGKDFLEESIDWTKESSGHQSPSTESSSHKQSRSISKAKDDAQPIIEIKGYEKNVNGEFVCLDCGKTYKTRCTYNLHKRL